MGDEKKSKKELSTGDYLSLAGNVLDNVAKARGEISTLKADAGKLRFEAKELRRQAREELTASQIQAYEDRQKAALAMSRVQAVAAAQGSAVDANTLRLIADFETEGTLAALTALYSGKQKSRALEISAAEADREAEAQIRAAKRKKKGVIGSLLGSAIGFVASTANPVVGAVVGRKIGEAIGGSL